jgi:hypothetical protein
MLGMKLSGKLSAKLATKKGKPLGSSTLTTTGSRLARNLDRTLDRTLGRTMGSASNALATPSSISPQARKPRPMQHSTPKRFSCGCRGTDLVEHWARRSLLQKLYDGPFLQDAVGWPAESWQTVAGHFRKLPGVKVRQRDLRGRANREGRPSTVTDYWLPKCSATVVDLAARRDAS